MSWTLAPRPCTLGVALWDSQPFWLPGATCRQGFSPQALPDSERNVCKGLPVLGCCPNLEQFHFPASTCKTDSCYLSAHYLHPVMGFASRTHVMLSAPASFLILQK